mmetsp:Transcript_28629/g.31795  ORF Transcript_28629/g.31795 Transcript_28629/m.31795 type:complete len:123 (+) Transcript_28629:179-547(+)
MLVMYINAASFYLVYVVLFLTHICAAHLGNGTAPTTNSTFPPQAPHVPTTQAPTQYPTFSPTAEILEPITDWTIIAIIAGIVSVIIEISIITWCVLCCCICYKPKTDEERRALLYDQDQAIV